jgi:hypothetical protein
LKLSQDLSLARCLIDDFKSLDEDIQIKMLEALDSKLKEDPQLLEQATKK